ncbi:MAG: YfhO family protein [Anaerolineae bacterium]|nr:YfhO family protein [Anaerolineae bacterium]
MCREFRHWPVALALAIPPLVLFWPFVFGRKVLFWGTPLLQFYPWRELAIQILRSGQLPLWNPYLGNGTPLAANLQSAVFYPLNFLYLFIPVHWAMGYTAVLHVLLSGWFMYFYGRTLGLSRFASVIGGLAYALSGYMVARLGFLTENAAFPWIALLFCLSERLVCHRNWPSALMLGLAIGVQFLAGHAQTWTYSMWAVGFYTLFRAWQESKRQGASDKIKVGVLFALAVLVGAGVAAVQVLPTWELTRFSQRASGLDWDFAMQYSFWPWRMLTLLAPDFFGNPAHGDFWGYATYWEDAGYIGVLPLGLALFAIVRWGLLRKRGRKGDVVALQVVPLLGSLAVGSLVLAMGKNTPIFPLVYRYVPGFGLFQAPARLLCIYTLAMATLAAIGAELLRPGVRLHAFCRLALVSGAGMLLAALAGRFLFAGIRATFLIATARFAMLFTASAILMLLQRPSRTWWPVLVVSFVAADLIIAGWGLNPGTDPRIYGATTASGTVIAGQEPARTFIFHDAEYAITFSEKYLSFQDFGQSDLEHWWGMREALLPNLGVIERLPSANNFDPLQVGRIHDLLALADDLPSVDALRLLGQMNVGYVITGTTDVSLVGLDLLHANQDIAIYRNPYALPRAWIVPQAQVISDPSALLAQLTDPAFDPRHLVLLEQEAAAPLDNYGLLVSSSELTLREWPNKVTITVPPDAGGYLVCADTWYPGWRAYVDGVEAEVLRANYAFRAVVLPPGAHEVVFVYQPRSFLVGGLISAATLGIAALLALIHFLCR